MTQQQQQQPITKNQRVALLRLIAQLKHDNNPKNNGTIERLSQMLGYSSK